MAFLNETFYADQGRAEVWVDKEAHMIKYYDSNGTNYFTQDFPDNNLDEVKAIAEAWTSGDHVLYG